MSLLNSRNVSLMKADLLDSLIESDTKTLISKQLLFWSLSNVSSVTQLPRSMYSTRISEVLGSPRRYLASKALNIFAMEEVVLCDSLPLILMLNVVILLGCLENEFC